MITYIQALLLGILQGFSELFPVSSLGHSVLFAWALGWNNIVSSQASAESFFVAFLVLLHIGTALALLIFYRKEWVRIIKGFFRSLSKRRIDDTSEKLAWLLIIATIPAGLIALLFEHVLRSQFAKPLSATIFLMVNGIILLAGDQYMKQHQVRVPQRKYDMASSRKEATTKITFARALIIGCAQVLALIAGISRSGITMVSGIYSGLDYEDSARFSFLLATPIIFAAGVYGIGSFFGNLSAGVRGQLIVGGIAAFISAYIAVRFLDKYFRNRTLRPFGIYCLVIGALMLVVGLTGLRHF